MTDTLYINGRKSIIVNPILQPAMGIFLEANYLGKNYQISKVHALAAEGEDISLAVLRFDREDRRIVPGELNHILVMTNLLAEDVYRATGIDYLPNFQKDLRDEIKWHDMGTPTVEVSPAANQAIKSIRTYKRELEEFNQNPGNLMGILAQCMRN